jgi:indole-3-glycerol phosphate synthase
MTRASTPDLLEAIIAATRKRVATREASEPYGALEARAAKRQPRGRAFREALTRGDRLNVIAECKRRSPSRGVLRQDYDPVAIATAYERAGAAAISVLTEPTFFDGSLTHLEAVRGAVQCPLLRKDFLVDEYQLLEAAACGADAVLLIVAALADADLTRLHRAAEKLGLAALVEVHDTDELDRAIGCGAQIIGVNNRNLRTLEIDIRASETIAARLPTHVVAVSESGLKTADDLEAMQKAGYHAFLIGERFMTAIDPGDALAQVVSGRARSAGSVAPRLAQ